MLRLVAQLVENTGEPTAENGRQRKAVRAEIALVARSDIQTNLEPLQRGFSDHVGRLQCVPCMRNRSWARIRQP